MLRVAVIGAGHMGASHARVYAQHPGAILVAVCDPDENRGRETGRRCAAPWRPDGLDLPGRVDAVSICVPTHLHYAVAAPFLRAGTAVLLEKPIAATVDEGRKLVALGRAAGAVFQIGHIERFNPAVRGLAARLRKPRFLEIHRLGPFKNRGIDVSVVTDLMIHDLDLALDLVRAPVKRVDALGISAFTGRADIATARIFFANGTVANLTASRISDKSLRKVRVFEAGRYWSLDCERRELACYRKKPPRTWRKKTSPELGDLIAREMVGLDEAEPLKLEIDSFLAAVRGAKAPEVSGEDGLRALRLARKIEARIARGNL